MILHGSDTVSYTASTLSGFDITTEAAITKMMYLFGLGADKDQVVEKLQKSLRGEMTVH